MTYLMTLYPKPPYHFGLLLKVLARYAHPSLDFTHEGAYWRALRTGTGRIPPEMVSETFAPFGEKSGLAAYFTLLRWVLDEAGLIPTIFRHISGGCDTIGSNSYNNGVK